MAAREHLVVVLPGIGGSVLARPGDESAVVWSAGLANAGNMLLRPERLSLGEHEHLDPVGLITTRKAFGVWTAVSGYDNLLRRLGRVLRAAVDDGSPTGHDPFATVVAVPYDFRRSVVEAADRLDREVRVRLNRLWPGGGDRPRVVIVAHSLGGLVARFWLAQQDNGRLCRALITLATPHRGAPKALDVLANGVDVKLGRITRPVDVLREWPSVMELLPRYPAVLDHSATADAEGVLRRPHELDLDWLRGPAEAAWKVHQDIEAGWAGMPRPPQLIPRIGYGHGTLRRCTFDGQRVRVTTEPSVLDRVGEGLGRWTADLGDGTVPADSGLPLELDGHSPRDLRVWERHGPIADHGSIPNLLASFEGRPTRLPTRGKERPVVLGLDLHEVAVAGSTVSVAARIAGTDADVSGVAVWATLDGLGAAPTEARLEWDRDHDVFRSELLAARPGLAKVTVTAEAVPGGADLRSSESVEVVNDDRLD